MSFYFKGQVGNPEHVIVWGTSLGTGVVLTCIEKYPGIFDGAVAESGPIAGLPMQADWGLGLRVAYEAVFGWPEEDWGTLGDAKDGIDFVEFMDTIIPQYLFSDPLNWEFISRVTGFPVDALWELAPYPGNPPWPIVAYMFFTIDIAALEQTANGTVMQNLDHVYSLTDEERDYLVNVLLMDEATIDSYLAAMNELTDIEPRKPARKYLERYFDFSGDITGPVITIHNIPDPLCIVAHTGVYRDTVEAAGKGDLLFQIFDEKIGHCFFFKEQYIQTVVAMNDWLDGTPPILADFVAVGFEPVYEPPPWPFAK